MTEEAKTPREFGRIVADALEERARDITDQWVEELSRTVGISLHRLLPSEELLDHIPNVIRDLGDYLRVEELPVHSTIVGRLRLLASLRREQGFDVKEILTELGVLSRYVWEAFLDASKDLPSHIAPQEVAEVAGRLQEGLSTITFVTVTLFEDEREENVRLLSERLAEHAGSVAHELRNPLGAAMTSVELLRRHQQEGDDQASLLLDLLQRSLRRIEDLISDVKLLASAEKARTHGRWLPLIDVITTVFEDVRERAKEKGVELVVKGELPSINVDASRIEIALANLLSNAIKYSDPDKEERFASVAVERLESDRLGGRGWCISVRDNGIGIPAYMQSRVFRRHFRAHPEVADGTGLGLAITRQVVTEDGGDVWLESEEGEGTTFFVALPERQEGPEKTEGKRQP